jgi:hypothetical protein
MLRRVALVRTDVSEERSSSIIRVTKIGELGTTLAVTSTKFRRQMAVAQSVYLPCGLRATEFIFVFGGYLVTVVVSLFYFVTIFY